MGVKVTEALRDVDPPATAPLVCLYPTAVGWHVDDSGNLWVMPQVATHADGTWDKVEQLREVPVDPQMGNSAPDSSGQSTPDSGTSEPDAPVEPSPPSDLPDPVRELSDTAGITQIPRSNTTSSTEPTSVPASDAAVGPALVTEVPDNAPAEPVATP